MLWLIRNTPAPTHGVTVFVDNLWNTLAIRFPDANGKQMCRISLRLPVERDEEAWRMSLKDRARVRAEALEEFRQDAEQERQLQECLSNWKRRTMWVGVALALCIGAIAPFTEGSPLHQYWGRSTTVLVYLAMCLFSAFVYAAGITYTFWKYLRDIRKIHEKFTPPFIKYRTGKS